MEFTSYNGRRYSLPPLKKILLAMKLTFIIILAGCLHISAATLGQTITLSEKNTTLEKVLTKIEKQSGYTFWYKTDLVKQSPKVSLDVKNYSLEASLDACFKDLPIGYTIVQKTIVLNAKEPQVVQTFAVKTDFVKIKGRVTDDSNAGLPGVTVRVKGTSTVAITDNMGVYQISVPDNSAILVFSFIGFNQQEVQVNGNTSINIKMAPTAAGLNEVSVTSFGIKKKTNDLGYSVTTVQGDELDRTNTVSPIAALQGKIAGVVTSTPGTAGIQTSPFIQIRGANTIGGNNQPIFVIDGNVLYNNLSAPDGADGGSQLKNLNPDDYASITVLKGAAATALYGSRGINGAVVITTKSGKLGQGLGVEVQSTYQATNVYAPFMKLQNEFGQGSYSREGNFAADGTQSVTTSNWGPAFDGSMHPSVYDPTISVPYVAQPNNWKTFYRQGNFLDNNVTISGGSDNSTYRLSYSNTHANGMLPNNGLDRNALTLKYSGKINKVFSTELGVNYANTVTTNYYDQSRYAYGGGQNLGFDVYYLPRNTDFAAWKNDYRNADNSLKSTPIDAATSNWIPNAFSNIDKNNYANHENSVLAYLLLKAQVNPWLDFSGQGNVNYYTQFGQTENYGNNADNTGGQYAINGSTTTNYEFLLMGHATTKLMHDKLNVDFRLLNNYYGNRLGQNYSATTNGGLLVPNDFSLLNSVNTPTYNIGVNTTTGLIQNNGDVYYTAIPQNQFTIGAGADINLNYKQYLNLELTARNDWLSQLTYPASVIGAANNYSVFYPSANASWSFYEEFKEKMPSWLSSGRLRASWAEVGNAGVAGAYSTSNGYGASSVLDQNGNTVVVANQINGTTRPNLDLKPQIKREIEIGTNLSFFKNLITLDFDVYKSNTYNQLLHIAGVEETGYSQLYLNAGNIQNEGFEMALDINPINPNNSKDWNLDFGLNLAHNQSKVISFYPGITSWALGDNYEGAQVYAYQGGPLGVMTVNSSSAFQIDGKTGYPIIKNAPVATGTGYSFADYQYAYQSSTAANPRVNVGKIEPDLTGGFSTTLRYKSFSLFTQIDGRLGGYISSESYTYAMGQGSPAASLQYRDQAHGGVARTDSYTGKTVYDGAVPNAVFAAGETSLIKPGVNIGGMTFKQAYQQGLVAPWYAPAYYDGGPGFNGTYDWENGLNYNGAVAKDTYIMLREITFGYNVPTTLLRKIKAIKGAKISLTARNVGYLYNSLPGGQNPESLQSNDPFNPFITGGVPFARTYAVSLDVKF